jgi:hypothetical protein
MFGFPKLPAAMSVVLAVTLSACGGGSGPNQPEVPADAPPTVRAGTDQAVGEGTTVTLAGQASDDGGTPAITWTQVDGPAVTLSDAGVLAPTFEAPVTGAAVTLTFRLTADDGVNSPRSDTVAVRVRDTVADSFLVDPLDTDAGLTPEADHVVAPPLPTLPLPPGGESPAGKLLVFLPGTGAVPADYADLVERAAALGYAGLGLDYINEIPVNDTCGPAGPGAGDADCHGNLRLEILTGQDASPYIAVSTTDSIEHRLQALLDYLARTDASHDWASHLDNGEIDWSGIAVAGHSQGGGHAAFIGKQYAVDRALLFSATEPVRWTEVPGVTPASDYYGFANRVEFLYPGISNSWINLALPGTEQVIEVDAWQGSGSHRLLTRLAACNGDSSEPALHQCTSSDAFTPRDGDGDPAFAAVWDFLFTDPGLPAPARDIAVGTASVSYDDPEFLQSGRLAIFTDLDFTLWVAEIDPHTGGFVSTDGRDMALDTEVAPFTTSNLNGAEFGEDRDGWSVFYTKAPMSGMALQIFRATPAETGVETVQLTDGIAHSTPLAETNIDRDSVQVLAVQGVDPGSGPIVTFDEATPDAQIGVIAARDNGINGAFLPDSETVISIDDSFDGVRQLVTVDLTTGARTQVTFDAADKSDVQVIEDPADGSVVVVALLDRLAIGIWRPGNAGFVLQGTLPAPAASQLPNVRSTELFAYKGRLWVTVNAFDQSVGGISEIWVYALDGSQEPQRCDAGVGNFVEPEPLVVSGRVYVYYTDLAPRPLRGLRRCVPDL